MKKAISIALTLFVATVTLAQEKPERPSELADQAGPAGAEQAQTATDPLTAERQALERLANKYDQQIEALQELALTAKGEALVDLHRQIEGLKAQHAAEELQTRLRVARETGNERRLQQMEQLAEELSRPRPTPAPTRERREGEER